MNAVAPVNVWERIWLHMFKEIGGFGIFMCAYTLMAGLYAVGSLGFYYIDKHRLLDKYKIQPGKYATTKDYSICLKNLMFNYLVYILPIGIITFPLTNYLGMTYSLPLPNMLLWCWHIFLCMVGEDFFHYWIHRYLHTTWAYQNIHKLHHYYLAPFGATATYSHPIEILMEGVATFLPVLIIRPHFFTFYCWFVIRQFDAVITHCGYDLPFPLMPFHGVPFYGGTVFHDYHHKAFTCNYASRFTYLDHLFGTYREAKKGEVAETTRSGKKGVKS